MIYKKSICAQGTKQTKGMLMVIDAAVATKEIIAKAIHSGVH
jgi:hypothetical protein